MNNRGTLDAAEVQVLYYAVMLDDVDNPRRWRLLPGTTEHPNPTGTFEVPAGGTVRAPGVVWYGDDLAEVRVSDLPECGVILLQPPDLLRFEEKGRSRWARSESRTSLVSSPVATVGDVRVTANDDVKLDGERILLNT